MSVLKWEPYVSVNTMDELLALAYAMEQEAASGYSELSCRMRKEGRPDLAGVFDRLATEERQHVDNVTHWSHQVSGKEPEQSQISWQVSDIFDDEGAGTIAPELLNGYRAFSMAVRNEERAFVFWTYMAARAPTNELREAAETMAREELGHVATLRRERRLAFHKQRTASRRTDFAWDEMELRLSEQLEVAAARGTDAEGARLRELARQARLRADSLARSPFGNSPLLQNTLSGSSLGMAALCELLLDCYLDFGERLPTELERNRAQKFAAAAVHCLTAIR